MNTSLDCMPCFMKMVIREARLACPDNEALQNEIVMAWGHKIGNLDLQVPPPEIARHLAELIRAKTGCGDLYAADKRQANDKVMQILPRLQDMLEEERAKKHGDPLALALELAIIGNYIDRGVDIEVDWETELHNVSLGIDEAVLDVFRQQIRDTTQILVLGDNTGEIVLDTLLVKELQRLGKDVTYAVRSFSVINDATMDDAEYVGMTQLCRVVESGVDTPGTVLERCSADFIGQLERADVILSKGQGNFESLEGRKAGVFCAFKVKCKRVARDSGLPLGSSAFVITKMSD